MRYRRRTFEFFSWLLQLLTRHRHLWEQHSFSGGKKIKSRSCRRFFFLGVLFLKLFTRHCHMWFHQSFETTMQPTRVNNWFSTSKICRLNSSVDFRPSVIFFRLPYNHPRYTAPASAKLNHWKLYPALFISQCNLLVFWISIWEVNLCRTDNAVHHQRKAVVPNCLLCQSFKTNPKYAEPRKIPALPELSVNLFSQADKPAWPPSPPPSKKVQSSAWHEPPWQVHCALPAASARPATLAHEHQALDPHPSGRIRIRIRVTWNIFK